MDGTAHTKAGWLATWRKWPLYGRILGALVVGIVLGLVLGKSAHVFELPAKIILQLLGALAPPLILIAVTHVLMTTEIAGKTALRLGALLILNTVVAICIGLFVANTVQPGRWSPQKPPEKHEKAETKGVSPVQIVIDNIPKSLVGPLGDKPNVIGVIFIACAFGIALRGQRTRPIGNVQDIVEVAYQALITVLHWVIDLVPIGVLSIVAKVVGTEGFAPFQAMGAFIVAVLMALVLQAGWYLLRIRFFSWCRPLDVLRGMRDSLVMAFSTGSSTATMPVTYACLKDKVGVREESASLGSLVGANFNNDGTALYEAMSALFVAQLLGIHLSLSDQLLVVLTSIVASVGAAGIPEAGLVTMTLVFTAVKLPTDYIALLLTVDWFLDRCRTTINVLGDVNVSCLLDGRMKQTVPIESVTSLASSPAP
ncbi:MAG: dicarboxylate/amino acid:cation symporter [Planctomycetota bacterium]|nr:MAG: dicarboxylate/amino acid:cation symporter [Planctomycetota bacterium]